MRRSTAFRVDKFCGTSYIYFDLHSYKYSGLKSGELGGRSTNERSYDRDMFSQYG